jgi:primosomal protein N' (replication factor Y) (superfamily II helicase)
MVAFAASCRQGWSCGGFHWKIVQWGAGISCGIDVGCAAAARGALPRGRVIRMDSGQGDGQSNIGDAERGRDSILGRVSDADGLIASRQGTWFGISDTAPPPKGPFAGVVFNRPIDNVLSYHVPSGMARIIRPGQRVRVPLGQGNKLTVGHCVRVDDAAPPDLHPARIKDVAEVLDPVPLIDANMLALTRWIADYYACSWGQALDAVVPAGVKKHAGTRIATFLLVPEEVREALLAGTINPPLTSKQAAVMEVLGRGDLLSVADVCRRAKCAPGLVHSLRARGLVRPVRKRLPVGHAAASPLELTGLPLETGPVARAKHEGQLIPTADQAAALERLTAAIGAGGFAPFLIHGVTGSGKTEVYLTAIEEVVALGREAIVLVPEISLTPQTIERFSKRFGKVSVLHSHLSDAERHRYWQSIASGEVQVIVGARSAVFAPARRLGLIVIDEEHESTFKQETTPRYHARDVGVKRAQMEGIPVLLGSATPSLESWQNAQRGRYSLISMPIRVGGRPMPRVEIIDLRHDKTAMGCLSEPLRQAMMDALSAGGEVMLLLNRRGFNTFALCPRCGEVVKCHACDVATTYHKKRHVLICHTCDAERTCPTSCPRCGAPKLYYGGVGTERLEREIQLAFPDFAARRMDSDTMRGSGSHERVLKAFQAGEVRILLGTQMIAKGLDFPNVTLVGVVSADTALHLPDFRAAEKTFQLVAQVAGRTGRGDKPGRVLVQTYSPEHAAIRLAALHDFVGFADFELPVRKEYGVPPFGRLVRVIARGSNEAQVQSYMDELGEKVRAEADPSVRVLGPAPAPVTKIRNLYRFHLQLRCPKSKPLQALASAVARRYSPPEGVEVAVDVDPTSML